MKTIEYTELKVLYDNKNIGSGSFGCVRIVEFNNKQYAYKSFALDNYLNNKKEKIELIHKHIDDDFIVKPLIWVNEHGILKGYLTEAINGKDMSLLMYEDTKTKIEILKDTKNKIIKMNEQGLIHFDLIGTNMLIENLHSLDNKKMNVKIIDLDNSTFKGYKTNTNDVNNFSNAFFNRYGITKEVDTYLFNILTYSTLLECDPELVPMNIDKNKHVKLQNKDFDIICETMFLDSDIPNKDFLIDTIDETKIII